MKRKISVLLIACMVTSLVSGQSVLASVEDVRYYNVANMTEAQLDEVLVAANVPETELEEMDVALKRFIIESAGADIQYVKTIKEEEKSTRSSDYNISEESLKLEVYAFRSGDILSIYPLYEWLVPVKPKGKDYFGYATSSSYSARPGERSNLIWTKFEADDDWVESGSATYTAASLYGYQHKGSSLGTPDGRIYIRGHFHYKVDIDATDPVKKIVLSYVHDTTSGTSYSYGVSYGPGSISVTPSATSNVGYRNGVFSLEYN